MKKFLITLAILAGLSLIFFFNIYGFLSPNKPVVNAKILVVDAWLGDQELSQAAVVFKKGNYSRVLVPGGQIERSLFFPGMKGHGELSAIVLISKGISPDKISPLFVRAVKKDRTYQAALTVKHWLHKNKLDSCKINLFTASTHARRSWLLYKKVFTEKHAVGILSATPVKYDAKTWWKTSNGVRAVIDETIAFMYGFLFFHTNM